MIRLTALQQHNIAAGASRRRAGRPSRAQRSWPGSHACMSPHDCPQLLAASFPRTPPLATLPPCHNTVCCPPNYVPSCSRHPPTHPTPPHPAPSRLPPATGPQQAKARTSLGQFLERRSSSGYQHSQGSGSPGVAGLARANSGPQLAGGALTPKSIHSAESDAAALAGGWQIIERCRRLAASRRLAVATVLCHTQLGGGRPCLVAGALVAGNRSRCCCFCGCWCCCTCSLPSPHPLHPSPSTLPRADLAATMTAQAPVRPDGIGGVDAWAGAGAGLPEEQRRLLAQVDLDYLHSFRRGQCVVNSGCLDCPPCVLCCSHAL